MTQPIFDKTNWVKVTFGDIAREVKEASRDPLADGFKYFVGLDHMDSEDLQLHRWGELSKGVSFTKVFRKGQILFGRRRAYQKKAVIAPFDGICSGDILVFEPNTDFVIPEFFPYIIQNDKFFDHAIKTSAGSLSPRTKFKDLTNLGFLLPPQEKQRELAELLISSNSLSRKFEQLNSSLERSRELLIYDLILHKDKSYINPKEFNLITLEEMTNKSNDGLRRGPFGSSLRVEFFVNDGVKVYEQSNVIHDDFNEGNYYINVNKYNELKAFEIHENDILVSCSGTIGKVAIVPSNIKKGIMNQALLRIRLNPEILPEYFKILFESKYMQKKLIQITQGSAMKNLVALKIMKKTQFPIIDLESQKKLISIVKNSSVTSTNYESTMNKIYKHLLSKIFV